MSSPNSRSPTTRRQFVLDAQNLPLKELVSICGPVGLENAVDNASANPAVGTAVTDLRVALVFPFSPRSLRLYLTLVPNVVSLDLSVKVRQLQLANLFEGVRFPRLRLFKTNYDHSLLLDFLGSHKGLTDAHVMACDAVKDCPLRAIDLSHITSFAGPSECLIPHVHRRSFRLSLSLTTLKCRPASILLRAINAPLHHLYVLILDFYPDEYDLLEAVVVAAPRLRKLKLSEAVDLRHRRAARRPWNDGIAWAKALRRLPFLEQLLLRTASSFVRHAADVEDERRIIMRWIRGARNAVDGRGHPHPTLYHIGVWYRVVQTGTRVSSGVVSHWSKPTGDWERTAHLVNPPPSFYFM